MYNQYGLPSPEIIEKLEPRNYKVDAYYPVSYTHLDVYKRQVQGREACGVMRQRLQHLQQTV